MPRPSVSRPKSGSINTRTPGLKRDTGHPGAP
nr:MAG TPA: hypothetical protein [Caudoviricetes sp.]